MLSAESSLDLLEEFSEAHVGAPEGTFERVTVDFVVKG